MKVLFVKTSIGTSDLSSFDVGIGSLSSVLKMNGHDISLFQLDEWSQLGLLNKRIKSFCPDVLAFSSVSSTFPTIKRLSKIFRKKYPNTFQICGGIHITIHPNDFLKVITLNAICLGEGEICFTDFINKLNTNDEKRFYIPGIWIRDKNGKVYKNTINRKVLDINSLPDPDRKVFYDEGLLWHPRGIVGEGRGIEFLFSRGCPFNCSYCSNNALNGLYNNGYLRFKDPKRAIEEIRYVVKTYKFDFFQFHDDIFTLNHDWLNKFLKEYRKIKVPFVCNIRAETCDKNTLLKLKKSGCIQVNVGVESGDEGIRRQVLNRNMSNESIIRVFKDAKDIGLKTFAFIIIGFPEETPKNFIETIKLILKIKPDDFVLYIFHPYVGTELYKLCKKKKLFSKHKTKVFSERTDTVLNLPKFKREYVLFYYENAYLLRTKRNIVWSIYQKFLLFFYIQSPGSFLFFFSGYFLSFSHLMFNFLKHILKGKILNHVSHCIIRP